MESGEFMTFAENGVFSHFGPRRVKGMCDNVPTARELTRHLCENARLFALAGLYESRPR